MKRVVLASGNQGKLREFSALLAGLNLTIVAQSEFLVQEAEETGTTFVENALIKARNACLHTGLPALADDSGLIVDALDGEPGVRSARYAGEQASDQDNIHVLLGELASLDEVCRRARYHCTLVYMRHAEDPDPILAQADWHGTILPQPRGDGGFGYDPVFWLPQQACTVAELEPNEKNRLGHRGRAMQALLLRLQCDDRGL